MKKAWKIISDTIVWIIVLIAVAMMIFTIVSVNTFDRNDRALFGHKMYIVLSDSMSATDFDAGDLVVVRQTDPSQLKEGDVISFISQNSNNPGEVMTHKIRRLTTTPSGEPGFVTYGTTTGTDDEAIVTYAYVQGKYAFSLPKVGSFFQFLKTPQGYLVCILLPFLLLIAYQGINCVRLFRRYKKEQMEELQAEKDAIVAERERAEEMMAQLMAFKKQLDDAGGPAAAAAAAPAQAQPAAEQVDVAAMMAELAALRAQVSGQSAASEQAPAEQSAPEEENTPAGTAAE